MSRRLGGVVLIVGLLITVASIVVGSESAQRETGPADDWFWDLLGWSAFATGLVGVIMFGVGARRYAQKD